jgi:CRISPR-associated protein Cas5 subtype I-C
MTGFPPVEVKVWGDRACFTRPEMKAERVSYPVMTPSAARGVLEAIFWKPEFAWRVREIWVLKPVDLLDLGLLGEVLGAEGVGVAGDQGEQRDVEHFRPPTRC